MVERPHGHRALSERGEAGPARPALAPADHHATGATHPDAAGVAKRQRGILRALHVDERVQDRGIWRDGDGVLLPPGSLSRRPAKDPQRALLAGGLHPRLLTNAATACPISSGESSCTKCRPLTVTSR